MSALDAGRATVSDEQLSMVANYPETCQEGVTRRGYFDSCDAMAVAVRFDNREGGLYPVCARHARRPMVPLSELLRIRP